MGIRKGVGSIYTKKEFKNMSACVSVCPEKNIIKPNLDLRHCYSRTFVL